MSAFVAIRTCRKGIEFSVPDTTGESKMVSQRAQGHECIEMHRRIRQQNELGSRGDCISILISEAMVSDQQYLVGIM